MQDTFHEIPQNVMIHHIYHFSASSIDSTEKTTLQSQRNEKVASQSAKLSQTWFVRWLWCDMYVAKYDLWDRAITDQYHGGCWWPVASFTKEVNLQLAKCPLKTNGHLANRRLTSLVKEATGIYLMSCICNHHDDVYCLTDITQVLKT